MADFWSHFLLICRQEVKVVKRWDIKYLLVISPGYSDQWQSVKFVIRFLDKLIFLRRTHQRKYYFYRNVILCYTLHLCHKHSKSISIVSKYLKLEFQTATWKYKLNTNNLCINGIYISSTLMWNMNLNTLSFLYHLLNGMEIIPFSWNNFEASRNTYYLENCHLS